MPRKTGGSGGVGPWPGDITINTGARGNRGEDIQGVQKSQEGEEQCAVEDIRNTNNNNKGGGVGVQ